MTARRGCGASALVATLVAVSGCGRGDEPTLSPAAQRGRATYMNVCVACHNANPALDGSLGPNLVGATRELIEWRVLRAGYPPGYHPKRESNAMPAFPHLADQIDDLAAFVAESTGDGAAGK